ncbi:hypothetical protein [Actinoplanes derwentensis]|uniref:Uncharacterized protein n=1 Tax=Actinoplanes derwentensis TaxID=113562 RepID=A0A1H1V204_9ACTN|nr:hypothetical protein [Actinoplanes derwentensis]GID89831.1 hypothetical protein Ade03nite_87550 [Actinoplanes derwentensis]SDS78772.1 hypothetical protein SAMN04489716_1616 [Actinoplanes derwentensis]
MGLLTGKALEYAKSIVALLWLVLTGLAAQYDTPWITTGLIVVGAFSVWLVPNRETKK